MNNSLCLFVFKINYNIQTAYYIGHILVAMYYYTAVLKLRM